MRGGSWNNNPNNARSANRNYNNPTNANNNNGLRVVVGAQQFSRAVIALARKPASTDSGSEPENYRAGAWSPCGATEYTIARARLVSWPLADRTSWPGISSREQLPQMDSGTRDGMPFPLIHVRAARQLKAPVHTW